MKLLNTATFFASLCFLAATSAGNAATEVAFVSAESGLGDISLNDMIAESLCKANKDFGVDCVVIQPRFVADFQSSLVRVAGLGFDPVIGASFDMASPIKSAAIPFPKHNFAILNALLKVGPIVGPIVSGRT